MKTINLSGSWTLQNKQRALQLPAQVPGDNHSALLAAGKIEDPYWAANELDLQWIGREDWIYERSFHVPASFLAESSIFLHADALDTMATIFLNGRRVARTCNAFVQHRFEVKPYLHSGANTLSIRLASPGKAARSQAAKLPYPIPFSAFPIQSPHRNLLRKAQCHSGWDWGPCLMVSGIYGRIYLGATSLGRIEQVYTSQKHGSDSVELEVNCEVKSPEGGCTNFEITLGGQFVSLPVTLKPGLNHLRHPVRIENPQLWWPNGYGGQPLYDLTVRVAGDCAKKRIGLRRLEVINKKDGHGVSLVFVVNGVSVFCKGANWIPADALPQRQTREVLDDLLSSAARVHMNMIRVWGGGQYESDDFYDLCDEKGLLVWQDFMFACSLYPASAPFLRDVREEAVFQVKRLRDHPSLALWCGNNENVGALNWHPESRANRDRYLLDYDRLNEGVLGNTVRELDPDRLFWPSSPCGGPGDFSDCWHADDRGDMHFWSVWHEGKPFEEYLTIRPRFCSEFGYQSFPSLETIRTYATPDQWNATAPVMEHHQRHPRGNAIIVENFARYFRMPEGFGNFVYLSQVQQGIAIQTAVEHFRRCRPVCMGALYWQLNDLWPVCSWASLEDGGKWKLLHYMAKRFYAPLLISATVAKGGWVEIWASNDGQENVPAKVSLRMMDFKGGVHWTDALEVSLEPGCSKRLKRYRQADLVSDPAGAFLSLELSAGTGVIGNDLFFAEYKKCRLADSKPVIAVKEKEGLFEIELKTDLPALWVSLNADGIGGEFDDNCFTLLPDRPRILRFAPKTKVTLNQFRKALKVHHLRATYRQAFKANAEAMFATLK